MRTRVWIRPGSIEHEEWRKLGFAGLWEGLRGSVVDRNRLRRVERIEGPSGTTWLKRFEGIQWKNAWRLRFSTRPRCFSQAGREEAVIRLLGEGGFRAPEILAWGEEGALLRERRSFLLTRSLEGRPLSDLEARKEEIPAILGVAGHLGATVRAGIFLPDLGLDHVFRAGDGSLSLLDFHNARSLPRPTERELGRALVRFFLSPGGGAWLELGVFGDFAGAYLEAARRPEAWKRVLELARARLDLPGGRDSSGRYEVPGKAEAFARRNPVRDRQERSHLRALIREAGWEGGLGTTLDAACGTGRLRSLLEDMGADWVGLDRSASMLRRARAEIPGGPPSSGGPPSGSPSPTVRSRPWSASASSTT